MSCGCQTSNSEIPSPPDLNETWGTASDDVYVLGDEGTLVHFDGIAWTRVPGPHTNGTWNSLEAVSGSSSESVVAVGANGTILRGIR